MSTNAGATVEPAPPRAAERHTTVLYAELHSPGQADTAARYLRVLGQAAELSGGRVLHSRENGVLALFSTPNAAAAAAARMHTYADTLPPEPAKPGLRIGFHAGPVRQREQDIFGDTVNLAIQVAEQARNGQVLVSDDTASGLSSVIQDYVRPLRRMPLKGAPGEMLLGELVWRDAIKPIAAASAAAAEARVVLRVTCSGRTLTRRRQGDSVSIGRDAECDLRVEGAQVSRRHCRLVVRGRALVLLDESTNGSFVAVPGKPEMHVRGGELALPASGRIGLGQPCSAAGEVVTYACG